MYYYKFNIGDFDKCTRHLSIVERGLFRDLLDIYIKDEKPVTDNLKRLERLLCIRTKAEKQALYNVLEDFFVLTDDGYYSEFCQAILKDTLDKAEASRENGKKGGRPKKQGESDNQANDNQEETQNKPNENPEKTQTKPSEKLPITHNPLPNTHNPNNLNLSHSQAGEMKNEKNQVGTSIQHWQAPTLDEMRSRLMNVGFVGVLNQETYDHCLNKFKTYWQNQEMQGNFLVTDDIRLQKLTDWVKQERPSREYRITDNGNSDTTSQPTTPEPKLDPNHSAWAGDRLVPLFPNMTKQQMEVFLSYEARINGLTTLEAYEQILKNTNWQTFDYESFNKKFKIQQAVA